jgi:hypothetical protein
MAEAEEGRVWHLGATCRSSVALVARADFQAKAALDMKLMGFRAPEPAYAEHAVFVGWPEEPGGDKPLRMAIAQGIADASTTVKPPPPAAA